MRYVPGAIERGNAATTWVADDDETVSWAPFSNIWGVSAVSRPNKFDPWMLIVPRAPSTTTPLISGPFESAHALAARSNAEARTAAARLDIPRILPLSPFLGVAAGQNRLFNLPSI